MIKIVQGVYGFLDEHGIVRPKTEADGPFELLPEQEERLVRLGVAEYVGKVKSAPVEEPVEAQEPLDFSETPDVELALSDLSVKELRAIGKEYGISFAVGTTKSDMVAAIEAAEAQLEDDTEDGDDEPAPVFDAAEAVL